jgi:hypothetical protein
MEKMEPMDKSEQGDKSNAEAEINSKSQDNYKLYQKRRAWVPLFVNLILFIAGIGAIYFAFTQFNIESREQLSRMKNDLQQQSLSSKKWFLDLVAKSASTGKLDASSAAASASAMQALEQGKLAMETGQDSLALTYFFNGVSHDPGNLELLNALAHIAIESEDRELMARAQSVLELSVYQVSPTDLPTALGLLANVQNKFTGEETAAGRFDKSQLGLEAQELMASNPPDKIWNDETKLLSATTNAEDLLTKLDVISPESQTTKRLREHIFTYRNIEEFKPHLNHVDNCLELLKRQADKENPSVTLAESVLSSANNGLANIWVRDTSGLPPGMMERIESYPDNFREITEKILYKAGKKKYNEAVELLDNALSVENGSYTDTINMIKANTISVQRLMAGIQSEKLQYEIQTKFEGINERINDLQKKRYKAYQKWVLNRCDNAWRYYDKQKVFVNSEAIEMFNNNEIAKIDQTLLSPEVSSTFNFILGKILNELPGEATFELEREMAQSPKKSLEDF